MTKLLWTATFLAHKASADLALGGTVEIRFNATFDEMESTMDLINSKHDINNVHIVNAFADSNNFICANISEIWDAHPAIRAHQSIKSYREHMVTYPTIYTQAGLDEMIAREGW